MNGEEMEEAGGRRVGWRVELRKGGSGMKWRGVERRRGRGLGRRGGRGGGRGVGGWGEEEGGAEERI